MHLVYSSVYLPPTTTTTMPPASTTTSCNPLPNIIKIILDACWTQRIECTHPLQTHHHHATTTTTTSTRRTDSKASHSRWCWWSLNIPLRRHSPSQMFVTIFLSFFIFHTSVFMFRAKIPELSFKLMLQTIPTLFYCHIVSNFQSFHYYFLNIFQKIVNLRRVRHLTLKFPTKKVQIPLNLTINFPE